MASPRKHAGLWFLVPLLCAIHPSIQFPEPHLAAGLQAHVESGLPPVPPIDPSMARVLGNASIRLIEVVVEDVQVDGPPAPVVYVISGLTRHCDRVDQMRVLLQGCLDGNAAAVALLQHYALPNNASTLNDTISDEDTWSDMLVAEPRRKTNGISFSQCRDNLLQIVRGSKCRLILGNQRWVHEMPRTPEAREAYHLIPACAHLNGIYNTPLSVRVLVQTLAVGRAFAWAKALLAPAQLYVRVRLDSAACAPDLNSERAKQTWPPSGPRGLLMLNDVRRDRVTGAQWARDMLAIASSDVAPAYFEAWRIWDPFNCSNTCFATGGSNLADTVHPAMACYCLGELPLSKHLMGLHTPVTHVVQEVFHQLRRPGPSATEQLRAWSKGACCASWPDCPLIRPPMDPGTKYSCKQHLKHKENELCCRATKHIEKGYRCRGFDSPLCVLANAYQTRPPGARMILNRSFDFAAANSLTIPGERWWESFKVRRDRVRS
jgi:hypothetical protein